MPEQQLSIEEIREKSKLTKEEWREYTMTVWSIANVTHSSHPAVFPEEIPRRLIKLFSYYGETVLDPFAGTGTTASAALSLGRNVICVEQNTDYIPLIQAHSKRIDLEANVGLTAIHGDSRNLSVLEDESVGIVVTSPPYWNKADYGNNPDNLGNIFRYREFLHSIRPALTECYRVLMPGRKLCLVTANVNQYTDHGLLTFPLATDLAIMLRELGFVMITEIIWSKNGTGGKWGSFGEQRPIFGSYPYPPNFLFKNVHEYILVFKRDNKSSTYRKRSIKIKLFPRICATRYRIDTACNVWILIELLCLKDTWQK
jgi:site-specific DNA-methyltransferase (adenine-specific)